ncbi:unnamed protein product [Meganyctiphanes norvegica]|uniref:Uncharacterized protein n=1 Tax=Meganyctiphanes norvegica TaxID=48144 RepID=A0AAV2QFN1_MEGNR
MPQSDIERKKALKTKENRLTLENIDMKFPPEDDQAPKASSPSEVQQPQPDEDASVEVHGRIKRRKSEGSESPAADHQSRSMRASEEAETFVSYEQPFSRQRLTNR